MLLYGVAIGHTRTAALLASALSERNPFRDDVDISQGLEMLAGEVACPRPQQGWLQRTRQLATQFEQQLKKLKIPVAQVSDLLQPGQVNACLLAMAYPDRIARRRHSGAISWPTVVVPGFSARRSLANTAGLRLLRSAAVRATAVT